jgi:Lrp/AsnC family transcriptional regulator for asnA, asnC and gidA
MDGDNRMLDDLDATDIAILRRLQQQGRTPTAQIARGLGLSEPTVRKRIDRLFQDEIIKVVAVLNPRKTGYASDVLVGIRVEPGKIREVGQALSKLDHVVYLGYTTGRNDILVEMLFRDDERLFHFLEEELPSLHGILSTETSHVLHAEKINYDWKLPAEFGPGRANDSDIPKSSPGPAPPAANSSASNRFTMKVGELKGKES